MREKKQRKPLPADGGRGGGHSRRSFLKGMSAAAGATVLLSDLGFAQNQPVGESEKPEIPGVRLLGRGKRTIALRVNGKDQKVEVEPRTTLLEAIREGLGLTGSKEVCGRGTCGACTVLLDGVAVCSCLMLALDAQGRSVTTIEGLAEDPAHGILIEKFCEHDAAQCGFCIPGFVVRSAALLGETPSPTPEEIRRGLSGNLCRCGTYTKIVEAVGAAAPGGRK